jgi:SHS2 domain-containing protein
MKKKFEFLEHTADTKIKAYGKTLEEAFVNVALASTQVMTDLNLIKEVESRNIEVSANNVRSLLYDFLEELLFLLDTEGFLVKSVKNMSIKNNNLSCVVIGDFAKNYEIHTTIKAITYSDMEIKKSDDGFMVQIVHDL